ncbi:MAG: hypothetical protein ABI806_24420 [Candidatus Solibacter sp.]
MDASRSESAHQAVPIGPVTLVIKQTADDLSIETRRGEKGSAVKTETLTFKLTGMESSAVGNYGALVKLKAHWDGPKLIAETVRDANGATFSTMQVFSLDASGKELTVDKTLTIQHGYQSPGANANNVGKGRDVFVRGRAQPRGRQSPNGLAGR